MKHCSLLYCVFICGALYGQDTIRLKNPSFEGEPSNRTVPQGWFAIGFYANKSPSDIQPGSFSVNMSPYEGNTYVGMVVRDNFTTEGIVQELNSAMRVDSSYEFSIFLALSRYYKSQSYSGKLTDYIAPARLYIWGNDPVNGQRELLGVTRPVEHYEWKKYRFLLQPRHISCHELVLALGFRDSLEAENGNMLLDACSPLVKVSKHSDEQRATYDSENIVSAPHVFSEREKPAHEMNPEFWFTTRANTGNDGLHFTIGSSKDTIYLTNPSFEKSVLPRVHSPEGWRYTTPKITWKIPVEPGYLLDKTADDGSHYLVLMSHESGLKESATNYLRKSLKKGEKYLFSLSLAALTEYPCRPETNHLKHNPVSLRIWGYNSSNRYSELLASSPAINHEEWRQYSFILRPADKHDAIILEAASDDNKPLEGHLLVDHCSPLIKMNKQ